MCALQPITRLHANKGVTGPSVYRDCIESTRNKSPHWARCPGACASRYLMQTGYPGYAIVFACSEFLSNSTQDHRPWIFRFAATLPKAVYFAFTSQHLRNKIVRPARCSHLISILQNTLVCSPMQSSGERSYGGGYRGIGIRKRRGRNAR